MPRDADHHRLAEHLKRELAEAKDGPRAKSEREGEAPAEPAARNEPPADARLRAAESRIRKGSAGASPSHGAVRGISFNEDLVLAILAGRKTQTRRPVRGDASVCAYAVQGEVVFIREKWARRADGSFALASLHADEKPKPRWQAGRFMPREAARHFLRVLSTQLEPLADITPDDARAEGAPADAADPLAWFRSAWDGIYGETDFAWSKRPQVWVLHFERSDVATDRPA